MSSIMNNWSFAVGSKPCHSCEAVCPRMKKRAKPHHSIERWNPVTNAIYATSLDSNPRVREGMLPLE